MKIVKTIEEFINESLKFKKSFDGMFYEYDFFDGNTLIGNAHVRVKKGWNQFHIEVNSEFQGKGYAKQIFEIIIDLYDYISIPDGRILNPIIYKIIDGFKANSKYECWETKYDENIISNRKRSREEIEKIFG